MSEFLTEMDGLAAEIAKTARAAETKLQEKIDAFKALTPYYVQQKKKSRDDINEDDLPTFDNFADRIYATTENDDGEGESGLRGGRRNGN